MKFDQGEKRPNLIFLLNFIWLGNYVSETVHYYEHWLSEQRISKGRQTQNQDLFKSPAASVVIDRKL